jgi:hypothetical protein
MTPLPRVKSEAVGVRRKPTAINSAGAITATTSKVQNIDRRLSEVE